MSSSKRVELIDSLRGIAALSVLLFHYIGIIPVLGVPLGRIGGAILAVSQYGHLGVPIFFVISGYVIALTASRYSFDWETAKAFLIRRFIRLAPPYWAMIVIIASTILAGRAFGFFRDRPVTIAQVLAHFAYLQDLLRMAPLDGIFWTLCLEVQFYVVFATIAVLTHQSRPAAQSWVFVILTLGSLAIDVSNFGHKSAFPKLWHQFGFGVIAFYASRNLTILFVLSLSCVGLAYVGIVRDNPADFAIVLTVALTLLKDRISVAFMGGRSLVGLGMISYSLYLVHGFIGFWLSFWLQLTPSRTESECWVAIAVFTLIAFAFAFAFHRIIELRAVEWSHFIQIANSDRISDAKPPPTPT